MLKNQRKTDTKTVKYENFIIDIDALKNASNVNQYCNIVRFLLSKQHDDERVAIYFNTLIGNNILINSEQSYIFKPELYSLRYFHLQEIVEKPNTDDAEFLKEKLKSQVLLLLLDSFFTTPMQYKDLPFRILTNTLIHHRILINILDPSHKTNNTFKEMFYDENSSNR